MGIWYFGAVGEEGERVRVRVVRVREWRVAWRAVERGRWWVWRR